jgi:hypothetical protein
MTGTFWNGEPCKARRVIVIVGKAEKPTFWYANLEGQERQAVEVVYGDQTFYLDNVTDSGWDKVTAGKGSPRYGHRSLKVARVVKAVDWRESGPEIERERDKLDQMYDAVKGLSREEALAEIGELAKDTLLVGIAKRQPTEDILSMLAELRYLHQAE